jgi:hypothetical protein
MNMIVSVGPPPEKHADRVVAEMLRELAVTNARISKAIGNIVFGASDGTD